MPRLPRSSQIPGGRTLSGVDCIIGWVRAGAVRGHPQGLTHRIGGDRVAEKPAILLVEHRVTVPKEHEIIQIREPEPEELGTIEAAAELITTVARSRSFRRVHGLCRLASDQALLVQAR